ncbi:MULTISPECIES: SIS domain-containing protein [unclassified Pseudodesulfovibrio]|uniref:SIS domain-containing protein n=1 Tax=unclassified Pseudodesulfovibrio TaxID=2661612 RepID=UPI000FEC0711|nr:MULTISPECIES: SIS domain-containing protein [unclassified Pseudodesulfovibrio]MCJ2164142.1 SIS domain-containing protein [Pseudodesulfovibrio sp. S3-i]RWU05229.1 SIS domain-containing protein [Pseudodesulfovibrio sp. S3]
MKNWTGYVDELAAVLNALVVTDSAGVEIDTNEGFVRLKRMVEACGKDRRRVYFVGNGASASMASHFSTDLAKMSGVPTEVFTDPALITATGNDMGYAESFAFPLKQRMVEGEVLIGISSSGNSPNVVEAGKVARQLSGYFATFSAMSPDNAIRGMGDLNFYIPAKTYGMAESGHAAMLHRLVDLFK